MKITIIEDEKNLADKTAIKLRKNGFWVKVYYSVLGFKKDILFPSDLYIIDIKLKDGDGFELINFLRKVKRINSPIIITSWFWDDENIIYWLDLWADDYITKPFSPEELLARIRAIIRRNYKVEKSTILTHKNLSYDFSKKLLKINDDEIDLRSKELNLVELILLNKGRIVTKAEIINSVWWEKEPTKISDNNLNVTLANIRKKLWEDFNLKTQVNKGYLLE